MRRLPRGSTNSRDHFGHLQADHFGRLHRDQFGYLHRDHLAHPVTPGKDDTTRWLCLDFDGAGHADALADPQAAALTAANAFTAAGLPAYLERSGGGKGWHLWCFFEPPLEAAKAQALGRALAPKDAPLAGGSGELADPRSARGIEVFPKQPKLRKSGFGNLVWLPWWQGAAEGGNAFYRRREDGELEPYVPGELATAAPGLIDRVLAAHPPPEKPPRTPAPRLRASSPPPPASSGDTVWAAWRTRALSALPIDAVYGEWLTGNTAGAGWLECRDPASSTGDQHPSAGVADGTGDAERGTFHSFISGRTLSVFDFLVEHGGAADFRAARERVAAFSGVPAPPSIPGVPPGSTTEPLPEIRVNQRQLSDIIESAWRAVHTANRGPELFARAGTVARIIDDDGEIGIALLNETEMYGHLARIARWMRVTEDALIDTAPVRNVARDMLVYPHPKLPPLEAVVATPVFDRDGVLISTSGYHRSARLWYRHDGLQIGRIPERPTVDEISAARSLLLDDLLVDFPFTAPSDRAHALGALLLPFVRRMIDGCTPIHLFEAPTPGTGKGLLADLLSILLLGRTCDPTTLTRDEDETRKKITSVLLKAQPVILLDNIKDGVDSAQLASALTAERWSDRILGQSRMISLPNRATWVVTGNNPQLSLELARRCIRVRIDAKVDRPWTRTGFKHDPMRAWASANRAKLVHALVVLVQAWLAADRPPGKRTLGSFESWARVIGGILDCAEVHGFLQNIDLLYEAADTEGEEWREMVTAWWGKFGPRWVSASELLELALERELLGSIVRDKAPRSQKVRLGKALSRARDRHFANYRVVVGRNSNAKTAQYRLIDTSVGNVEGNASDDQLSFDSSVNGTSS